MKKILFFMAFLLATVSMSAKPRIAKMVSATPYEAEPTETIQKTISYSNLSVDSEGETTPITFYAFDSRTYDDIGLQFNMPSYNLPAGTYEVASTGADNTVQASTGEIIDYYATPTYVTFYDQSFNSVPYFITSGSVTVAYSADGQTIYMTGTLTSYHGSTFTLNLSGAVGNLPHTSGEEPVEPAKARVFASALDAVASEDAITFSFIANVDADSAAIIFMGAEKNEIAHVGMGAIQAGLNTVTVAMTDLPGNSGDEFAWGVKLFANPVESPTRYTEDEIELDLYAERAVVANTNPMSEGFGNIYVNNYTTGTTTGVPGQSVNTPEGLYQYNAALELQHDQTTSFITGLARRPYRMSFGEDGHLYVAGDDPDNAGIFMLNGCDITKDSFVKITDAAVAGVCATGVGADRAVFGISAGTFDLVKFAFGETLPFAGTPDTIVRGADMHFITAANNLAADGEGGFWCYENRYTEVASELILTHITSEGVMNWNSLDAGMGFSDARRGSMAVSPDFRMIALGFNSRVDVFSISWDAGVPTLTKQYTLPTGGGSNIDGITFDYAGNVIFASASDEIIYGYGLPIEENVLFVPARMSITKVLPSFKGAYTVGGEGADFASLYAACDSVNKAVIAGNLAGDIELLIAADLVEPKNIGLINNTDYTITIRPDQDADRTVLFTQPTDNDGPSGALVIGCDMGITFTGTATKNIVIDGFADGGDIRRLTFTTTDGFGSKAGPIVFYGDVTNSIIKNCIVTNTIYHSSTSAYAITLRNEKNTDKCPVGVIIENNKIEVLVADNGQGIYLNGSQAATAKVGAPKNTVVRNNEIIAATRGIFLYGANGLIAEGNTIRVRQHAGGRLSHGIMGNSQTGVITVRGNKFVELTTVNTTAGDYGIQAITASGGASVWMIENNFFGGFDAGTACAGNPTKICGVRMGDSCVVRHNTFEMPVLSNTPSTTLLTNAPITLLYYAGTLNYVVENNIFISHETAANNSLARGTITANTKNNLYYIDAAEQGNAVVMDAGTPAATFADLPADIQAKSINAPIELVKGYMVAESSLGNRAFGVPAIEGLMTDIDGADRHAPMAFVGCYEAEDINALPLYATLAEAVDGKTIRRAVACDDAVYVLAIDADKAPTLVKADFEGNVVTTFATDFCTVSAAAASEAGCMVLSDIALTADGVLVGINADHAHTTKVTGTQPIIYKWNADGTGAIWIDTEDYVGGNENFAAGNFGNATVDMIAYSGTIADGEIVMRAMTQGSGNRSRFGIMKIVEGAFSVATRNQDLTAFTATSGITLVAAPTKGNYIWGGAGIAPIEWTPAYTETALAQGATPTLVGTMANDYIGIKDFSVAKSGEKDLMIIPAEDGATILNVTSGLATATVVDELTTQGITCDFMHAALVANGTKVMLMRDADIILLDMPAGPGTNLNEIKADAKAVKVMRNGHVFIIRDGKMFNMQGMMVK